jgi:hypothetical protein
MWSGSSAGGIGAMDVGGEERSSDFEGSGAIRGLKIRESVVVVVSCGWMYR